LSENECNNYLRDQNFLNKLTQKLENIDMILDFNKSSIAQDNSKFNYIEERFVYCTNPEKDEFKINQRPVNGLQLQGDDLIAS